METKSSLPVTQSVRLAAAGGLDLMSFEFPTDDPQEKESRNVCVNTETLRIFQGRLSPTEAQLFASMRHNPEDKCDPPNEEARIWDKYDDVLIEQAAALGWRTYESHLILARIAKWSDFDRNGIEKLKRFNEAIKRHAEVKRNLAQLPFTEPEWYQTRKNALQEIKTLQKKLSAQVAARNRLPNLTTLYATIRAEIADMPLAYRYLSSNLTSFMDYLKRESILTSKFVTNQTTPADVLNGWFDYQGSTADGKSRQIISRIGKQKRQ